MVYETVPNNQVIIFKALHGLYSNGDQCNSYTEKTTLLVGH